MSDAILRKPLTGLLLLASAAGGPYVWYETEVGRQAHRVWESTAGSSTAGGSPTDPNNPWSELTPSGLVYDPQTGRHLPTGPSQLNPSSIRFGLKQPRVEQTPIVSLAEILRFDITPDWVMMRFHESPRCCPSCI